MNKKIIAVIACCIFVGLAMFGYRYLNKSQQIQKEQPVVQEKMLEIEKEELEASTQNNKETTVPVRGMIEDSQIKATYSAFESEASSFLADLLKECLSREVNIINVKPKRSPLKYVDIQASKVLTQDCGPTGQSELTVDIRGKDEASSYDAVCNIKGCVFDELN